jgi:uncharacterized protein
MSFNGITRRAFFVVALSLGVASIGHAQQAARIEQMSIITENSATFFQAEIADTDELRARGLMFRHIMPLDRAMLFDFGQPRPASMWMKNTYVSLDMLFVRTDGTIAAIAENTEPLSLQTISVDEPVKGVVELAAGTVKRLGIKRDDRVYHTIFKEEKK